MYVRIYYIMLHPVIVLECLAMHNIYIYIINFTALYNVIVTYAYCYTYIPIDSIITTIIPINSYMLVPYKIKDRKVVASTKTTTE